MNSSLPVRDAETWRRELSNPGPSQDQALNELRRLLLAGLSGGFGRHGNAFLEDIVQEAIVKILKHLNDFSGKSRFTTWAMSIAVRTALSELRHKRWGQISLEQCAEETGVDAAARDVVDPGADPAQQTAEQNLFAVLHHLIQTVLTPKQRVAILSEVAGMPMEEIAAKLESNLNATYKLLHDARKRLKAGLESHSYTR